ncbi:zinc finger protein 236 [Stomoxys calcitrans]|uniref:zinc finger protein 236 n=1 Tax=Stomoxys calcitrans TaxID=35570 RepID=UPI0027E21C33|nr:zinc finger protein 236 [Stomoxys calcitrans]
MENYKNCCRVCLQTEVILNWNEELIYSSGMSYRSCYFKYSQLPEIDSDPFPQFLCGCCSRDLKNIHLFLQKAHMTQTFLEQRYNEVRHNLERSEESKIDLEHATECINMPEISSDYHFANMNESEVKPQIEVIKEEGHSRIKKKRGKIKDDLIKSRENNYPKEISSLSMKQSQDMQTTEIGEQSRDLALEESFIADKPKNTKGRTKANTAVMCSYCSKLIHNAYYLKRHEQTHLEDRERDVTCSQCGLKTFNKKALYIHMKIHDKNREKKFKCEFCDKSFFQRGACNVHRRIHLGQMVKCPVCPKEFYRQVDLDRHMQTHSQTPLHTAVKPQTKYVVHCKECNKEINSAKFSAHRAAHMNEPCMQCTVCEKDFFSRMSCTRHMRRVHKRGKDNYDDIIKYYEKYRPRLSHVLMEQQEEVATKNEQKEDLSV